MACLIWSWTRSSGSRGSWPCGVSAGGHRGVAVRSLSKNDCWAIEGCYGELVEAASKHCTEMIFLNPGLEVCLRHNRARPWEPHKYRSKEEQDAMLETLQEWVKEYYERNDPWSYRAHRRIFDSFEGRKTERTGDVAPG